MPVAIEGHKRQVFARAGLYGEILIMGKNLDETLEKTRYPSISGIYEEIGPFLSHPFLPFPVQSKLTYLYVGIGSKEW